jgi:hypothetical protein
MLEKMDQDNFEKGGSHADLGPGRIGLRSTGNVRTSDGRYRDMSSLQGITTDRGARPRTLLA